MCHGIVCNASGYILLVIFDYKIELNFINKAIKNDFIQLPYSCLSNLYISYSTNMLQVITDHLGNLFNESIQHVSILNISDQQDVKLVETLLESDLRNLSEAMKKILGKDLSKVKLKLLLPDSICFLNYFSFLCN